ncbi:MAG: translocation/assembly module TamB domain-containing protein, partial [Flavisolibacter sp.]
DYIKLIDSSLVGFNYSHISGDLDLKKNILNVQADVPYFKYGKYDFSSVKLNANGSLDSLSLTGQASNIYVNDSINIPLAVFRINSSNDVSKVSITTGANQTLNKANLNAVVRTYNDGVKIEFDPSDFVLNGKTWTVEQGGELNFRKNTIVQGQLVMKESNQEIRVWTQLSDIGTSNDLHALLTNINLSDISPFLMKNNQLEGLLSGEIIVVDPQNKFNITSTLHADELRIDGDSIGRVETSVAYDNKTGLLTGRGNNVDPLHRLDFNLAMDFKDSANTFQDKINARLTNFEMKYLNRFLGSIFTDIKGYVTGNLDIVGEGNDRNYLAKAKITDGSFKVNFSQVTYTIDDTEFEMTSDKINLNNIRIRDPRGYPALVTGYISHKGFSDMYYDIQVETESNRVLLLNTSYNDNQQFFGRAYGSGSFNLIGEQNDMLMDINIKASETDSSSITLPPSRTRESGQASFLVERKYGREMTPEALSASFNMHYDIHLAANPMVTVSVILDELTGDAIQGKGTGNLKISSGTSEPLAITGRYGIDEGNYIFTFQSLLKKPFILRENANNYIEWNGDPYDATIRLEAIYTAEKVSFSPLASSIVVSNVNDPNKKRDAIKNTRDDVNVVASLTGNLFHPNFNFKLEFPSDNQIYTDPAFTFALQQIEKNQNELNRQVTYLIVFNSFAPLESSTNSGYAFGELYYNTISGLLFGKVNEQLNKILSKVLQNNNATLNLTGSLYNRSLVDPNSKNVFRLPDQSNFNLSLALPLFNDRAHFTLGATLDVPLNSSDPASSDPNFDFNQIVRLFPDVMLELMVNKSGSIKATFFYRENTDFFSSVSGAGVPRRFGASIGYGKEFNTLRELFGKKKDPPKIDTTQKIPPDSTSTN